MTTLPDLERLAADDASWRVGSEEAAARIDADMLSRVADVLEGPPAGENVPPLWHSVLCSTWPPRFSLGPDGHPLSGLGYPPVPQRRRLFAGARGELMGQAQVGDVVTRTTTVKSARAVQARSGLMLLATLEHSFRLGGGDVVAVEQHDLAYRSGSAATSIDDEPRATEPAPAHAVTLVADTTRLFRFSALTANSHRIHYDERYATQVEGLPGLLVHGPLLGLLLLEVPRRSCPDRRTRSYGFRVRRPVTAGSCLVAHVVSRDSNGWSLRLDADGAVVATGQVTFGES